ncbi:protein-disulfide reductase DsbD domain-containing protein [Haloferula sp. BvORR071]|uniref:protein-disulfide reductase DsbD domain-containing protein n=1 Tax=Haloferula sp. BvORR071 TaxID=1396141 RepID=UPI000550D203|nr:protein-disulfide reductase DsbD domain-containing protein [Haloferula sp. BvORR071]
MKPLLALLLTLCSALAEPAATKGVDVSLISEQTAIAPGQPFTVGLKIHHHPGFHTYWKNPGIAGIPVNLEWQLPEGFSAGPIQWPYPQRSMMAIHPVHGFERDVLLMVEITPPAQFAATTAELKATASWMACADGCYPGKTELTLTLPKAEKAREGAENRAFFAQARAELPQPIAHWKFELLSAVDAEEIRLRLTPADGQALAPTEPYFFSSDGQISSSPVQKATVKDGVIEITAARAQYGPKGIKNLPGVLISKTPLWKDGPCFAGINDEKAVAANAAATCPECEKEAAGSVSR